MMQSIYIDGKTRYILSNSDIADIIRERVNDELAAIIEDKLNKADFDTAYAAERAQTDAGVWESEVEEMRSCLNDILEILDEFQRKTEDKKTVRRTEFEEALQNIERTINNYI